MDLHIASNQRKCFKWAFFLLMMVQLLWLLNHFSQVNLFRLSSHLPLPGSHLLRPPSLPVLQTWAMPMNRVGKSVTGSVPARRHACYMVLTESDTHNPYRYFSPGAHPLNWMRPEFPIEPLQGVCKGSLDLVVLVPSHAAGANRRDTIRKTWGSVSSGEPWPHAKVQNKVTVLFLLGKTASKIKFNAVKEEAKKYGDLIVTDFADTYRNLTHKILAGLTWVSTHCSGASYVAKVDDDMFLNVELTLSQVNRWFNTSQSRNTFLGRIMCAGNSITLRNNRSRLFVPRSQYPFAYYPPYVSGGHYIIPGQLVPRLLNASRYMPVLPIEDVYITGILGRVLNVTHLTLPRILVFGKPRPETSVSSCFLSVHDMDKDKMTSIWMLLKQSPQRKCSEILLKHKLQTCSETCKLRTRIVVY